MNGLGNLGHLGKLGHASTSGTNHPEVEASGRAFPIWNTKPGDDKLLSLSIHGLTEQIGTPTPCESRTYAIGRRQWAVFVSHAG